MRSRTATETVKPSNTAGAPGSALLRVMGLTAHLGTMRVLRDVDLTLHRGEVVALTGENGAGKSTLVRCIVGDLAPNTGRVELDGRRIAGGSNVLRHPGVGVVWQAPAQCDNLDVTSNLMLGTERRWFMRTESRMHTQATRLLAELEIPIGDPTRSMQSLSRSDRQLVAIARAVRDRPALLVLDEPTASLGVRESELVERLISRLHASGTTILLVSHDIEQTLRLAGRVAVLRRGSIVAEVDAATVRTDDVAALIAGQQVDSSARRQLLRLQGLVDELSSSDASSGVQLILTALSAALGVERLCLHLTDGHDLRLTASKGLTTEQARNVDEALLHGKDGPIARAYRTGEPAIDSDGALWRGLRWTEPTGQGGQPSSYCVPVMGSSGVLGVITIFRSEAGSSFGDELDLVALYTAYVAGAVERDRLLDQVTVRNRALETIREALQALTGPMRLDVGLSAALRALREGTQASSVSLWVRDPGGALSCRAGVGGSNGDDEGMPTVPSQRENELADALSRVDQAGAEAGSAAVSGPGYRAVVFPAPGGPILLLAQWPAAEIPPDDGGLLADAAHFLRLAFEREEADKARRQAAALQRSQQLQKQFLSRLSHELRTPLTTIHGYASSLTQPDVSWDAASENRFVTRISNESSRLVRLVGDLLDFSAIESGVMRLHPDWCELPLVLEAAKNCLPPEKAGQVDTRYYPALPAVWADHDRLEQVFVNLMDNSVRHNPAGTTVTVVAEPTETGVAVTVSDDGIGLPDDAVGIMVPSERRTSTSGSGLGLSITRGIVQAHAGTIVTEPVSRGLRVRVEIPENPRIQETEA